LEPFTSLEEETELLRCAVWIVLWLNTLTATLAVASPPAADSVASQPTGTNAPSKFYSAEDGWLDVSGFLDETYGFVPLVILITEPAVGYGAAGGLAFIDKPIGKAQASTTRARS
jgi:hypothetical protein